MREQPHVGIIMGSESDLPTMEHAAETLKDLKVPYELRILSAHRTPDAMADYARAAVSREIEVIIAGAGGAAHLPGMTAAFADPTVRVYGVPIPAGQLQGIDAMYSILQMPAGVFVRTMAIGKPGAINAALGAAQDVMHRYPHLAEALREHRRKLAAAVADADTRVSGEH